MHELPLLRGDVATTWRTFVHILMQLLMPAASEQSSQRPSKSPRPSDPNTSAPPSPAASAATATTAGAIADRAAAELAQFQDQQFDGDDVDPDAPAAMKDSPSVSGDDDAGLLADGHLCGCSIVCA